MGRNNKRSRHISRRLLQKRNSIIKTIRSVLKNPKIATLIFGKSFEFPEISFEELETEVTTDSDFSNEEKQAIISQDIEDLLQNLEDSDGETNVLQEDQ